jgi:hypothetical protein
LRDVLSTAANLQEAMMVHVINNIFLSIDTAVRFGIARITPPATTSSYRVPTKAGTNRYCSFVRLFQLTLSAFAAATLQLRWKPFITELLFTLTTTPAKLPRSITEPFIRFISH